MPGTKRTLNPLGVDLMLLFIDQPKHIRVMRASPDSSGALKRERLGLILKSTLEPSTELSAALAAGEDDEVAGAIDMYRRSALAKRQAAALAFPEIARDVVEYVRTGASETEKRIIVAALMDAVRAVRKTAREAEREPDAAA